MIPNKTSILITAAILNSAYGAEITWDGSANNNWRNNSNWSGGGTPQSTDTAIFPANESDNDVDLSNSSENDVDRFVDTIKFYTDGTNSTSNAAYGGGSYNWGIRKGTLNAEHIYWESTATGKVITVHMPLKTYVSDTIMLEGNPGTTSEVHTLEMYGDTTGSGQFETGSSFNDILALHTATSFSGSWQIGSGTLRLRHPDAIKLSVLNLFGTGNLDIVDQSPTILALRGDRDIAISSGETLTVSLGNYYSGSFSGPYSLAAPSLYKQGPLELRLRGNSSLQGETAIMDGDVYLENGGSLPNSPVNIGPNGTLRISNNASIGNLQGSGNVVLVAGLTVGGEAYLNPTFSGELNNSGTLTFTGGTHNMTGSAGNFDGDVVISGGTVKPSGTRFNNSLVTVNVNQGLDLISNTTLSNLAGTGNLTLDNNLILGEYEGDYNDDATYSGNLSGSGNITIRGQATWTYNGTHSGSGITRVTSTGALGGSGTFSSQVEINEDGSIKPGNSTGTITADSLTIDGTYSCEIDGATSDCLDVAGLLSLGESSELDISVLAGGVTEGAYIIAKYGSLSGTFSSVLNLPTYYQLVYDYDDGTSSNNIAIIDNTPPQATTITPYTTGPTSANSITFDVTFSEPVTNFDSIDDIDLDTALIVGSASFSTSDNITFTVTINGISGGDGGSFSTLAIAVRTDSDVQDVAGNPLTSSVTSSAVTFDHFGPLVSGFSQVDNWNYIINFSEPIVDLDVARDMTLTTTGTVSFTGTSITGSGSSRHLEFLGLSGDGTITLKVNKDGSNIQDLVGNLLITNHTSADFTVEHVPPTGTITTTEPSPTNSSSISYAVSFNEPIIGLVDGTDLETPAINEANYDLANAVVVNSGDNMNFTVTLNQISGNGPLRFSIKRSEVTDLAGNNPVAFIGSPILTIDNTEPTVVSITPSTLGPTDGSDLTYTIVFDEPVYRLDELSDQPITYGDSPVSVDSEIISTSDNITYTVSLTGLSGEGSLTVTVNDSSNIEDAAGNHLASSVASSPVIIDTVAPTVTSITTAESSPTNAGSIDYTVTFREAVENFDSIADLDFGSGISPTSASFSTSDNTVFTVTLSGITGDGDLTLAVSTTSDVQDEAGNALTSSVTSSAVEIDNTPPQVISASLNVTPLTGPNDSVTTNATQIIATFELSEPITNWTSNFADFDTNGYIARPDYIKTNSALPGNIYTITLDLTPRDPVVSDGTGGFMLYLNDVNVTDEAGNSLDLGQVTTKRFISGYHLPDIYIDYIAPTVTSITTAESSPTNSGSIDYTVTFSEPVENFDAIADLDFGSGLTPTSASFSTSDNTVFTVTLSGITGDGDLTLAVSTTSDVQDVAGNALASSVTSSAIEIDSTAPQVVLIKTTADFTNNTTVTFTVDFSEEPFNFNDAADLDITLPPGLTYSTVTILDTPFDTRKLVRFSGLSGAGTLTLGINAATDTTDLAGNPLQSTALNDSVEINTDAPKVSAFISETSHAINDTSVLLKVTFDRDVVNFDDFSDLILTPTGSAAATGATITPLSASEYELLLTGLSGDGSLQVEVDPASDVENSGNSLLGGGNSFATLTIDPSTPVHYVSPSGSNTAPYDTWAKAAHHLQDAIAACAVNDSIWIAEGTYTPDLGSGYTAGSVGEAFNINRGLSLYGGFPLDGGDQTFSARDYAAHPTILSGEIGNPGDLTDNSLTLLAADRHIRPVRIDGLTVSGSYGFMPFFIQMSQHPVSITNCRFENNRGEISGGIFAYLSGEIRIKNTTFAGNYCPATTGLSVGFAGSLLVVDTDLTLENCTLAGNHSASGAGALALNVAPPGTDLSGLPLGIEVELNDPQTILINNTILWDNAVGNLGTGPEASLLTYATAPGTTVTIQNSVAENIDWSGSGGLDGTDPANDPLLIAAGDPLTAPYSGADLNLGDSSPAIDAGTTETIPESLDLAGIRRIAYAAIDLGAYEYVSPNAPVITANDGLTPDESNQIYNYLSLGQAWSDPGASATDLEDGSVPVVVGGDTVDPNTLGTYYVNYDATDLEGNDAETLIRVVEVVPVNSYEGWANRHGLISGINRHGDDNPDGDAYPNHLEYLLDGNPLDAGNDGKFRSGMLTILDEANNPEDFFSITFPWPTSFGISPAETANFDNYIIFIEGSYDLLIFNAPLEEVTPAESSGLPTLSPGWEYLTYRLAEGTSSRSKGFLRIRTDTTE